VIRTVTTCRAAARLSFDARGIRHAASLGEALECFEAESALDQGMGHTHGHGWTAPKLEEWLLPRMSRNGRPARLPAVRLSPGPPPIPRVPAEAPQEMPTTAGDSWMTIQHPYPSVVVLMLAARPRHNPPRPACWRHACAHGPRARRPCSSADPGLPLTSRCSSRPGTLRDGKYGRRHPRPQLDEVVERTGVKVEYDLPLYTASLPCLEATRFDCASPRSPRPRRRLNRYAWPSGHPIGGFRPPWGV